MSNSLQLSEEGIKIAQEAFRCKYPSQEALARKLSEVHICEVTRQPIGRFLKGKSISRQIFVWICEQLEIDVNKVVKPLSEPKRETTAIAPPGWHKICREMLEAQKQNLRRQVTQMGCELNVFVPLGLVDRKQQPRRSSDFSPPPERGSNFFQLSEEEIIKTYEHDEFLEQIIKQRQSKKSNGKRIAIIGEPGAGKTTLLEQIAFSPKTPGFPIWISLGSLGEKSLEEYLCQKWLRDALKTSNVTQQQKELEELFKSGGVLLLLDGVDEMPAPSPVEALTKIREELTGWVADARVVLTCRVNVWDASVNALQGFDTYRTLEFSYGDGNKPDQVREFICQWFSKADKPELGEPLREKLDEDRHQRIRDLVKNPLRLSLLCQSWYFRQGDLPKTKAALYEQFMQAFYDWKEEQFSTTPTKRKELNVALGLLAREAIDKEKARFGIRESFVIELMGEDLFNLACKLHWLNFVYKDAETDEKVYAFFHPTFQEYFAACVILDWHYFLNHNNETPNPFQQYNGKSSAYRVFDRQWKEVILLWLGREDIHKQKKEEFIKVLVDFDDGCGDENFYGYQSYFLGVTGIADFSDCSRADEIIRQAVELIFNKPIDCYHPITQGTWEVLKKTEQSKVIKFLTNILRTCQEDIETCHESARLLMEIDPANSLAERAFVYAVNALIEEQIINSGMSQEEQEEFLSRINQPTPIVFSVDAECMDAIDDLVESPDYCDDDEPCEQLSNNFDEQDNEEKPSYLDLLFMDEPIHWEYAQELAKMDIKTLVKLLRTTQDKSILCLTAFRLGHVASGNVDANDALIDLLRTSNDFDVYHLVAGSLKAILQNNLFSATVSGLKDCITNQDYENDSAHFRYCYEIIWYCAQNMAYPDFYQAWHGELFPVKALEN